MRAKLLFLVVFSITILWACSKKTSTPAAQQATVTLQDGSTFSGTVTNSSPSSITLQSAGGESRTYPVSQVTSVQYAQPVQTAATQPPAAGAPPAADTTAQSNAPQPAVQPPPVQPAPAQPEPAQPTPPAPAPEPAPEPVVQTIPAGTTLEVRNNDVIDSSTAQPGEEYSGVVASDVSDSTGAVAIPRGSAATLVVRSASGQGKFQGQSDIAVDVATVRIAGRTHRLETSSVTQSGTQGIGTNKRTATFAGGGAALGGIIGAIAGGGKGAAIGLLAGGAGGAGAQAATRGKAVKIPAETLLRFKLERPVNIR